VEVGTMVFQVATISNRLAVARVWQKDDGPDAGSKRLAHRPSRGRRANDGFLPPRFRRVQNVFFLQNSCLLPRQILVAIQTQIASENCIYQWC